MKITCLVENTSCKGLPCEHGLSLHVRLDDGLQLLFDMGQTELFAHNASILGIHLEQVDLAVLSHGHYDHGGGLPTFLSLNTKAPVYVRKEAFQPHYSLRPEGKVYIGLPQGFESHPRCHYCDDVETPEPHILLFSGVSGSKCNPVGNRLLYGPDGLDTFLHEQHLIVMERDCSVLFAGCAHAGIVNIIEKSIAFLGHPPTHVVAGMHLKKSGMPPQEETRFISMLAEELTRYPQTTYYTLHCTGTEAFQQLKEIMKDQLNYLACGEQLEL